MPPAVMNVFLLVVDLAAHAVLQRLEASLEVVAGDRGLSGRCGSAWPSLRSPCCRLSRLMRLIDQHDEQDGDDEHDDVRHPRPAARRDRSHSVWISRSSPSSTIDQPRPSSSGAGDAHRQPAAGALERAERLLLGVGLDEIDDVAEIDDRVVVGGARWRTVCGPSSGTVLSRRRPRASRSEAQHRLDVVEALGEQARRSAGRRARAAGSGRRGRSAPARRGGRRRERVVGRRRRGRVGAAPRRARRRRRARRAEPRPSARRRGRRARRRRRRVVGPVVDVGERVRVVGEPGVDTDPPRADGDHA